MFIKLFIAAYAVFLIASARGESLVLGGGLLMIALILQSMVEQKTIFNFNCKKNTPDDPASLTCPSAGSGVSGGVSKEG